jgi:hypothetical protein
VALEVVGRDKSVERDGRRFIDGTAFGKIEHGEGSAGVGTRAGRHAAAAYDGSCFRCV